jgi:hypothetical protein
MACPLNGTNEEVTSSGCSMGCQVAAGAAGSGLTPDTTDAGSSRLRAVARWVAAGGSFAAGHPFLR